MTHNQINYWAYKENVRHNQEYEAETKRHNQEQEAISSRSNDIALINANAHMMDAETNRMLEPSEEFHNYSEDWKHSLGGWINKGLGALFNGGIQIGVGNNTQNKVQKLVTDPHGGELLVNTMTTY